MGRRDPRPARGDVRPGGPPRHPAQQGRRVAGSLVERRLRVRSRGRADARQPRGAGHATGT
eukprot:11173432-Lingulodinium_polyedra.AAC.1